MLYSIKIWDVISCEWSLLNYKGTRESRSNIKSTYSHVITTPNFVAPKYNNFILLKNLVGQTFRQDTAGIVCLYSRELEASSQGIVDLTRGSTSKMNVLFTCLVLDGGPTRLVSAEIVS